MPLTLGPRHKAFPPGSWGTDGADFLAAGHTADEFQTPLTMLDTGALSANETLMMDWVRSQGFELAPHGKTTMAPRLWQRLLDAGATALTLATGWQVQFARSAGLTRIMLANELIDPVALRALSADLDAHPEVELSCWVDSTTAVERMTAVLDACGARRAFPVLVELGAPGGRAGARSAEEAVAVAEAATRSPRLALIGVGGYEGSLAHDRGAAGLAAVDSYLDALVALHRRVADRELYAEDPPVVTAGGSAFFDRVAERLGPLVGEARVVLRSGAFQIHDDGFYRGITPLAALRPAMHAWVRVISRPEPTLAILDGGKRDLPYDEGLPVPRHVIGLTREESTAVLRGSTVTALNDQHGFLRLAEDAAALPVGSVVRLGLSHPCTALDKWRLLPLVDDAESDRPRIVDLAETWF